MDEKTQTSACGMNVRNLLLFYIVYTVHCDKQLQLKPNKYPLTVILIS